MVKMRIEAVQRCGMVSAIVRLKFFNGAWIERSFRRASDGQTKI
jgi:hypothetical protein